MPHGGMWGAKYGLLLYKYSTYITVYTKSIETPRQIWAGGEAAFCAHYQPTRFCDPFQSILSEKESFMSSEAMVIKKTHVPSSKNVVINLKRR